jgi:hypothetical protein
VPKPAATPWSRPRIVRWLALCIAAGTLTTVIVAWAFAALGPLLIPEDSNYITHVDSRGAVWWEFYCTGGRKFFLSPPRGKHSPDPTDVPGDPPRFAAIPAANDRCAVTVIHGWPALCLSYEVLVPITGNPTVRGGFDVKLDDLQYNGMTHTLPYHIRWLGMIANVLLYTAAFACIRIRPRALIRWRRLRRGLCLSCGYDRNGLPTANPCPECGMP